MFITKQFRERSLQMRSNMKIITSRRKTIPKRESLEVKFRVRMEGKDSFLKSNLIFKSMRKNQMCKLKLMIRMFEILFERNSVRKLKQNLENVIIVSCQLSTKIVSQVLLIHIHNRIHL